MMRKLLTATAALAAVLVFAPAANAGTPATVYVNGTNGAHAANFSAKGQVTVDLDGLSLYCADITGTGSVDEGALTSPFYNDVWMRVSSSSFTDCDGPGGVPMDLTQGASGACDLQVTDRTTTSVTAALTDIKDVKLTVPAGCLQAQDIFGGFLCQLDIVGTVNGTFDENVKPGGFQELAVGGSGLTTASVSGCFGQVSNGTAVTFSLIFNVHVNDGPVNQKP